MIHSLERLVDLQSRSYRLLQWLNRRLVGGGVTFDSIHSGGTVREAFKDVTGFLPDPYVAFASP